MANQAVLAPKEKKEEKLYEQIEKNLRDWQILLEMLEKKRRDLYRDLLAKLDHQKAKEIYSRLNFEK